MTIEGQNGGVANRRLRLGMVGGGQGAFIGGVHRMVARLDDRFELVAGALSSDPDRAKASAAELHIAPDRAYGDFSEMVKAEADRQDRIDVVSIVTPNHMHFAPAKAFLEAGFHVICDKPMTLTADEARELVLIVESSSKVFALTHNYTGYPMVRQARQMIADGELGNIRVIQVEYPQDWLSTKLEDSGQKQAEWRTDPNRSGAGGCIGDIGTHAYNLAGFITGLSASELCAELTTFVEGRALDDNAQILLRYPNGARGMLWSSQVAPGNENALKIRVYGDKAGLEWSQENPNYLTHSPLGQQPRLITRGGPGVSPAAEAAARIPAGHPEGYLEGFANIYNDVADLISSGGSIADTVVPNVYDGLAGMNFIETAVASSQQGAVWKLLGD
jgi:predicted dehydrogenase